MTNEPIEVNDHMNAQISKKSSHKPVVTEHKRTRTGERTYECSDCKKKFLKQSNLTVQNEPIQVKNKMNVQNTRNNLLNLN